MAEKNIKSRIVHKHDIESNWSKATNFIPKQGEIIIYDIDSNYSYERIKVGDGTTNVNNLPFADANKVDKISGKSLSTNDYTTAEKNKLAGIAEGANKTIVDSALSSTSTDPVQNKVVNAAINDLNTLVGDTAVATQISNAVASKADVSHTHDDRYYTESEIDTKLGGKSDTSHTHSIYVNQNAFSNIKVGNTIVAADTTTDTVTLVAGNNITITPDATNDKITIAATDTVYTHPSSGVTAGTYKSVTVNAQGHVTSGSNPTTLSGYGITDAATKSALTAVSDLVGDIAVSTQISDYAAPKSHTHNYAGSSSVGGAAKVSESGIGITTAGTGSAYTATVPGITALTSGVSFVMVPHVVSASMTPTLNVNGLGAKNIKRRLSSISTSVQSGYSSTWLAKGTPFRVTYDGTQWIVDGLTKPAVADLYGTLSIEKGGTGATTATGALTNLGGVPTSRTINSHALTADIELTAADVGAVSPEDLQAEGYITGISGADVIEALGYTPVNQANLGDFTGASATQAGDAGLVPAPSAGDQEKFLRGDGAWATVSTSGGDYLPLTGGTLTGNLTVNGTVSVNTANRAATAENILADKGGVASDADTCLTVGVYATNTSTTNLPFATYGTLTVYKSAQNWIIQIWTSSTNTETAMYMRKSINGAGFGSWFKLLGNDAPVSIAQGGTGGTKLEEVQKNILDGTYPADGVNISGLAPGIYGLPNNTTTAMNAPVGSWAPIAFVFGHQNNDSASDGCPSGSYFQGYLEWEGELWLRRRKWDGWGDWMKYYSTKNIIYSSTQPSNASTGTIWLKPV